MKQYIDRFLNDKIRYLLKNFPAVAMLGPRQCGKSTLARHIMESESNTLFLDLEKISDRSRLTDPEMFFNLNKDKLICLDEIQRLPEIFNELRSVIDENERNGQFLILGSASRELIRQSSESLAGRIIFVELSPFSYPEVAEKYSGMDNLLYKYLVRGGFPRSFLAEDTALSFTWRQSFINTFLERDIPQIGIDIQPESMMRLWKMCAHSHGQVLNASRFGESLGISHTTVRKYLELLKSTFMIRILPPFYSKLKKRLIKSPKIYIRDTGILHALLQIKTMDDLMAHPVFGASWENMVIENVLNKYSDWDAGFYRTSNGAEIDLILNKANKRIAIECKVSTAPKVTRGFYSAMEDLDIQEAWVIAPVDEKYPLKENVFVISLPEFLKTEII